MRTASKLFVPAVFSLASIAAQAGETWLDFDNNQVPIGWTQQSTLAGSNWGIAGGRLYAGQTDSAGYLESSLSPLLSDAVVQVEWDGNLTRTYWGNFSSVRLAIGSLSLGSDEYSAQAGAALANHPFNSFLVTAGPNRSLQMLDLPDGVYSYKATFSKDSISFSGALNGKSVFLWTYANLGIDMAQVRGIRLAVYETIGPEIWIDNVHISISSAVPEPSGIELMLAGMIGLVGFRYRRGGITSDESS